MGWNGRGSDQSAKTTSLPINVNELVNLKQNKIQFEHKGNLVNLHTFNFIRNFQWNNMEIEVETIPDCVFRLGF